ASYSPYGEFGAGQSAPPQHSPFGFTGRQYDPETGLYQYRARYYSPRLGQFLSTDPIGTKDDPNLYMYVGLDPANATDPTGMQERQAYVGGRPIGEGLLRNHGHMYVATNARYPGDPEARIYSAGPVEGSGARGLLGPLVRSMPGQSINTTDTEHWLSQATDSPQRGGLDVINAPSSIVESVAAGMGGNPDYEATPGLLSNGGCNSNCWVGAVIDDSEAIAVERGVQPRPTNATDVTRPVDGLIYPGASMGERVTRNNLKCVPGNSDGC
ncbi:MAG: hypothetical protein B0A82_00860, partial [Alkalinema sp. CACIAM 70d]